MSCAKIVLCKKNKKIAQDSGGGGAGLGWGEPNSRGALAAEHLTSAANAPEPLLGFP